VLYGETGVTNIILNERQDYNGERNDNAPDLRAIQVIEMIEAIDVIDVILP